MSITIYNPDENSEFTPIASYLDHPEADDSGLDQLILLKARSLPSVKLPFTTIKTLMNSPANAKLKFIYRSLCFTLVMRDKILYRLKENEAYASESATLYGGYGTFLLIKAHYVHPVTAKLISKVYAMRSVVNLSSETFSWIVIKIANSPTDDASDI